MAFAFFNEAEDGVEVGSAADLRCNSSSNWLVLFTTSTAKVDFPEAGMPAIPTKRRLSEEMLG